MTAHTLGSQAPACSAFCLLRDFGKAGQAFCVSASLPARGTHDDRDHFAALTPHTLAVRGHRAHFFRGQVSRLVCCVPGTGMEEVPGEGLL